MSHVFISYSTRNSDYARKLADNLRAEGFDVWIDNARLRSSEDWWHSIVLAIRGCSAVVVILTPESDTSEWVQREITLAGKYKKPIFPLWLDGTLDTPNWEYFVRIQVEDVRSGKFPSSHLYDTLALHAPRREQPGLNVTEKPPIIQPEITDQELERDLANPPKLSPTLPKSTQVRNRPNSGILVGAAAALMAAFVIVLSIMNQPSSNLGIITPSATWTTDTTTLSSSPVPASETPPPSNTSTAIIDTPAPSNTPVPASETPTPSHTPTETIDLDATMSAEPAAISDTAITANSQWTPITQTFDGMEMVLVPKGCFDMGSATGGGNEQPVSQVCFDIPFWIGRTEVTNAQNREYGIFSGDNRPRENIEWSSARSFCEWRGARLPTEAEWEYAARGPDNLNYPWGNNFVADNVVYIGNSNNQTAPVGSKPGGMSWVGALDMSGNVWEWVSTIYDQAQFPYPYVADDGREDMNRTGGLRSLRGGAWNNNQHNLRATSRLSSHPYGKNYNIGFRCARDYE